MKAWLLKFFVSSIPQITDYAKTHYSAHWEIHKDPSGSPSVTVNIYSNDTKELIMSFDSSSLKEAFKRIKKEMKSFKRSK